MSKDISLFFNFFSRHRIRYYRYSISSQYTIFRFIGWRWKHIVIFPLYCRDKKKNRWIIFHWFPNISSSDRVFFQKDRNRQHCGFSLYADCPSSSQFQNNFWRKSRWGKVTKFLLGDKYFPRRKILPDKIFFPKEQFCPQYILIYVLIICLINH